MAVETLLYVLDEALQRRLQRQQSEVLQALEASLPQETQMAPSDISCNSKRPD
jgi:hypothetical protein